MVVTRFDSWCRNRHAVTSVVKQRAPILDSVSDVYFNMVVIYQKQSTSQQDGDLLILGSNPDTSLLFKEVITNGKLQ